jgi:hypothetical protein
MKQTIAKDNEYIGSILSLLYNNKGDCETGEDIELGNHFIELWKRTEEEQRRNLMECWTRKTKPLPYKDILEELTKTLKRIIKPYEELKKTQGRKARALSPLDSEPSHMKGENALHPTPSHRKEA